MTNPRHRRAGAKAGMPETRDDPAGATPLVERLVLLAFLTLIPLRAVLSETHGFESPNLLRGLEGAPSAAGPATTFVIISTIAAGTVALACSRLWRGGPSYRRTGAELGALLLVVAAVISTTWAGQKHLALIGVLDFLGMIAFMLALRQLLTRQWHIRLALCVIIATGALVVTKAIYQIAIEYPDTQELFEEHYQKDIVQSAGPEGAGQVHDFEMRLKSQAATGYFQHPNVFGSYLILICVTSLAVAASRFRRRPNWCVITPSVIAIGGAVILVYTQSKGAVASLGVAFVVWMIAQLLLGTLKGHPRAALAVLWMVGVFGCIATIGVLRHKPDALGRSMQFRLFYWNGAIEMTRDQGYAGVGANNFGRWFSRFKSVECPEVVQAPHSWIVRLATEWGLLGTVGFLLVLLGISNRMSRSPDRFESSESPGGSIAGWGLAIIGCIVGGWLIVLAGGGFPYLLMTFMVAIPSWILAFGLGGLESSRASFFMDDDLGPVLVGLCSGAVGFLVHTSIDLAMFHPGSATTFFAIVAIALAIRDGTLTESPGRSRPVAAVALGVLGAIVVMGFAVGIAGRAAAAGRLLETARSYRRDTTADGIAQAGADYDAAAEAYPLDGTALKEHADELLRQPIATDSADHVRSVRALLSELARRDPRNASLYAFGATVDYQAFALGGDVADINRALTAMRHAVADAPTSPNMRLRLAGLLVRYASVTGSEEARWEAAREFRNALDLDDRSIYVSKPHRYSEARREAIRTAIQVLSEGGLPGVDPATPSVDGSSPTTTAPLPTDRHTFLYDE